jgi:hypothetical protein
MARFFKHIGEHNGKKVIIVQRALPGEEHLAAVVYSQIIPTRYHDDIMSVLQSDEGQQAKEFMDIMNRRLLSSGANMLVTMVNEGFVKKAQANQIIVKPNANSAIRLDELNKLLKMAGEGTEAIRKLEELDRQQGRKDPIKQNAPMPDAAIAGAGDVLDDSKLASNYMTQAARMRVEAKSLLDEATRLEGEAKSLSPVLIEPKVAKRARATKTTA